MRERETDREKKEREANLAKLKSWEVVVVGV